MMTVKNTMTPLFCIRVIYLIVWKYRIEAGKPAGFGRELLTGKSGNQGPLVDMIRSKSISTSWLGIEADIDCVVGTLNSKLKTW